MARNIFAIQDKGGNALIKDSHYYTWLLSKKPKDIHAVDTKVEYLIEQGFKLYQDKLTAKDLSILKAIEEMYFYWEIKPILIGNF